MLLALSILAPHAVAGPPSGADAIRTQLPVILTVRFSDAESVVVDGVVTEGADGYAVYKSGGKFGYAVMHLRDGKWWLLANGERLDSAGNWTDQTGDEIATSCVSIPVRRPSAQELIDRYNFSSALAESAIALLDLPPPPTPIPGKNASLLNPGMHIDCILPAPQATNGKPANFWLVASSADPTHIVSTTVTATAQTKAEGASVEVWAPYALDASKEYVLTVGAPAQNPQRILGWVARNTLHFVVPPIAGVPNAELMLGVAVLVWPQSTKGDEGSPASARAIRRDFSGLFSGVPADKPMVVDRVLSDGSFAVADWHTPFSAGFAVMAYKQGRWTRLADAAHDPNEDEWTHLEEAPRNPLCVSIEDAHYPAPSAQELIDRFGLPRALAQTAFAAYFMPPPVQVTSTAPGSRGTLIPGNSIECTTRHPQAP
jgi:hypothetical protein